MASQTEYRLLITIEFQSICKICYLEYCMFKILVSIPYR